MRENGEFCPVLYLALQNISIILGQTILGLVNLKTSEKKNDIHILNYNKNHNS